MFHIFVITIYQRLKNNYDQVFITSKDVQIVIWLKSYNDSDPSNNKKLAKIVQTQPNATPALFSLSISEFLQFYRQDAFYSFLEIFYISMLTTCVTQTTDFLHLNVKSMRIIRPFLDNSVFEKKDVEQFAQESF